MGNYLWPDLYSPTTISNIAEDNDLWKCEYCEKYNQPSWSNCLVCGKPKPQNYICRMCQNKNDNCPLCKQSEQPRPFFSSPKHSVNPVSISEIQDVYEQTEQINKINTKEAVVSATKSCDPIHYMMAETDENEPVKVNKLYRGKYTSFNYPSE